MRPYRREASTGKDGTNHDGPTWSEIRAETETEMEHEELLSHISVEVDRKEMTEAQRRTLDQFCNDAVETLAKWKKSFAELQKDRPLPKRMRDFLEQKRIKLPRFRILSQAEGNAFLTDVGLAKQPIRDGNLLVVFNLPKPLSKFWWKGKHPYGWGNPGKNLEQTVVEWGYFYQMLTPLIWELKDRAHRDVNMERINPINVHDPDKYYYLWELSDKPFEWEYSDEQDNGAAEEEETKNEAVVEWRRARNTPTANDVW